MIRNIPLAWLQLFHEKTHLLAALAGITFAVMLMLMQLGFRDALYQSSTKMHEHLRADLVLISPQYEYLYSTEHFSQRRLYQALAFPGVASVEPLYLGPGYMKNPETRREHRILILAFRPESVVLDLPGLTESLYQIQQPETVVYDRESRREFGPIAEQFLRNQSVVTEVNGRRVYIRGFFELGPTFGVNGNMITSDLNFLRLVGGRRQGLIDIGLIRLRPGVDPEKARAGLAAALPSDVEVLTRRGFVERERRYWVANAPVGFVFNLGALLGVIVGMVIVYQILYTDVSDHLAEYATLKAIGRRDRYLFGIVLQEALILAVFGTVPGFLIAAGLYSVARDVTHLPLEMTRDRFLLVFALTVFMCSASGFFAMRKLRSADPAEIF